MPGWRAGLGVGKYTVQCREPKTGHQKVQLYSITKTIHVAHLGILFIYGTAQPLVVWLYVSRDKHMDFKNVDRTFSAKKTSEEKVSTATPTSSMSRPSSL